MSAVINLRQFKKTKLRAEKEEKAHENRIKFGRSKRDKNESARQKNETAKFLDQHLLKDSSQ